MPKIRAAHSIRVLSVYRAWAGRRMLGGSPPTHLPDVAKPVSDFGRIQKYAYVKARSNAAGGSLMSDEAVIAQTGPFQVELTEGQEYWYCRCGRSKTQPFCDGSHEGTSFVPLQFTVDHTGVFNICGCKATDDEPFCDGTHNVL